MRHSALASPSILPHIGSGRGVGRFQQANHGERQLLFFQISAKALAGELLLAPDVQDVVGNLEGDAQVTAVMVECLDRGLSAPA